MYEVKFTSAYKRSYRRMKKAAQIFRFWTAWSTGYDKASGLIKSCATMHFRGSQGFRECHIKPDWLLVYLIDNDVLTLTLVETGTHSQIFGGYSLLSS